MSIDVRHNQNSRSSPRRKKLSGAASEITHDVARWLGTGQVLRIQDALREAGVELSGPHSGQLVGEDLVADVTLEPDDLIRVQCGAEFTEDPRALLQQFAGSAGSVRCGLWAQGLQLVAETRVDGVTHLPRSLHEIRTGFLSALHPVEADISQESSSEDSAAPAVRAAIEQAGWSTEEAVETSEGYELQPQIEGGRVGVQVVARPGAALVQRTVLEDLPDGTAGSAVAHQALVWNARLRCCRLVVSGGRLCVETRLHAKCIDSEWLSFTARAVAAAARSVEPELELLAREPTVARAYAEMFLSLSTTHMSDS